MSSQWPLIVSFPFDARAAARDGRGARLRRATVERRHVAEPERLEVRQVEAADGAGHVPERVRALVAVVGRVGQLAGSDRIEHDDARAGHPAILRSTRGHVLGILELIAWILAVTSLAGVITYAVIKIFPGKEEAAPAGKSSGEQSAPTNLGARERQCVLERHVRQAVRLCDRCVGHLPADDVDAASEGRVPRRPPPRTP